MSSKLARIEDWESSANATRYRPALMAKAHELSLRQLERRCKKQFAKTPHALLHELRMRRAFELLRDGTPVKEVAFLLTYKDATHFSHDFRHFYGMAPSAASPLSIDVLHSDQMSRFTM